MTKSKTIKTTTSRVDVLLTEACASAVSACEKAQAAALAAAPELDKAKPLAERIKAVIDAHKGAVQTSPMVRSYFADALACLACANERVEVPIGGKDKAIRPAGKVVGTANRRQLREAAKQVYEAHGLGRKSGAGRKAKDSGTIGAAMGIDSALEGVKAAMAKPDGFAVVQRFFAAMGYVLNAEAKPAKRIAKTEPVTMATLPTRRVHGAASATA